MRDEEEEEPEPRRRRTPEFFKPVEMQAPQFSDAELRAVQRMRDDVALALVNARDSSLTRDIFFSVEDVMRKFHGPLNEEQIRWSLFHGGQERTYARLRQVFYHFDPPNAGARLHLFFKSRAEFEARLRRIAKAGPPSH